MGNDVSNDIGVGTCTMKYSPKINEKLCGLPQMADLHGYPSSAIVHCVDHAPEPRDAVVAVNRALALGRISVPSDVSAARHYQADLPEG